LKINDENTFWRRLQEKRETGAHIFLFSHVRLGSKAATSRVSDGICCMKTGGGTNKEVSPVFRFSSSPVQESATSQP
jgi:hypothetical protein